MPLIMVILPIVCLGSAVAARAIAADRCGGRGQALAMLVGAFGPPGLLLVSLWRQSIEVREGPPDGLDDEDDERW